MLASLPLIAATIDLASASDSLALTTAEKFLDSVGLNPFY